MSELPHWADVSPWKSLCVYLRWCWRLKIPNICVRNSGALTWVEELGEPLGGCAAVFSAGQLGQSEHGLCVKEMHLWLWLMSRTTPELCTCNMLQRFRPNMQWGWSSCSQLPPDDGPVWGQASLWKLAENAVPLGVCCYSGICHRAQQQVFSPRINQAAVFSSQSQDTTTNSACVLP